MSVSDVLARIAQIQALATPAVVPAPQVASPPPAAAARSQFATALAEATAPAAAPAEPAGSRVLAAAESQVGQTEQPPGSNDGPAIAQYRGAVAGAVAGAPWCAYFASWAAAEAGVPIGDGGRGLGAVSQVCDWAQRTGRLVPSGMTPQPGDLILFGSAHVGIVESVAPDGTLTTIEGNEGDAVTRRTREPGEATGYVRL